MGPKPQAQGDHELAVGLLGGGGEFLRLGDGSGQRFFADEVFAGGERRLGHAQVRAGRGANIDGIDRVVGEEVVEILVCLDLTHVEFDWVVGVDISGDLREVALESLGVEVADRRDVGAINLAVGADVHRGHEAKPDDADVDVVVCHGVIAG